MAKVIYLKTLKSLESRVIYPDNHRAIVLQFPTGNREISDSIAPLSSLLASNPLPAPALARVDTPVKVKRGATEAADYRKCMLAKIHIALKELYSKLPHFDEEFYRDELDKRFKTRSSAGLSNNQLDETLLWLKELGFKAKKGRNRKSAPKALFNDTTGMGRKDMLGKIEAMLAEKGRVEGTNVPWGYAMAILKNKSKGRVTSFEGATLNELRMVIAALYNDANRKGRRAR